MSRWVAALWQMRSERASLRKTEYEGAACIFGHACVTSRARSAAAQCRVGAAAARTPRSEPLCPQVRRSLVRSQQSVGVSRAPLHPLIVSWTLAVVRVSLPARTFRTLAPVTSSPAESLGFRLEKGKTLVRKL